MEQSNLEKAQMNSPNQKGFKKVLVVDDIMYVVKSISRILSGAGYFVISAMTGKEALEKFIKYKPDLLTVDQKLPDMTGDRLVELIRENDKGKTPVVFISAVHARSEIKPIINLGVSSYILKPFKKEKLLETVKKLIG